MKIKKEFMKRQIAGECVVVPIGDTALTFNGMMTLNEVGEFLWDHLLQDITLDELIEVLMSEYDVSLDVAKNDVIEFVNKLYQVHIME